MIKTILTMWGIASPFVLGACLAVYASRLEREKTNRQLAEMEEAKEKDRGSRGAELLEKLSRAYRKAKKAGVHNFWLVAVSQCCWKLRNGEEIDEGAALFALRGLEGDESQNAIVNGILEERKENRGDWD